MHPNPKKSMVDPLQPLKFSEFKDLNNKIKKLKKFFKKIDKFCMIKCGIIGYPIKKPDQ